MGPIDHTRRQQCGCDVNERDTLPSVILQSGIVAVLRTATADDSVRIGRDLLDLGLGAVELTLTTPGALEAVRRLRAAAPAHVAVWHGNGALR